MTILFPWEKYWEKLAISFLSFYSEKESVILLKLNWFQEFHFLYIWQLDITLLLYLIIPQIISFFQGKKTNFHYMFFPQSKFNISHLNK